ncbi:histidine ammonia-lyase [Halobacteriales archaeon QS_1_68_20]|nr:MAG: histidine ammonia-lyase [Halobacteriales archaeon QS_1_68_20]
MTVEFDGETMTVGDVVAVAREDEPVAVPEAARERIRASRERVEDVLDSGETVYGVNTGFGELVDQRIPREDIDQLQLNLVRSHASGVGEELPREAVRAMLATRINALAKGYSGVRERVVDLLVGMVNWGVHPVVPAQGSLGASGDLAPLAHVALVLIGEGEARVDGSEPLPGNEALAEADLDPVALKAKEGLALINGTQLTVGLAALLVHDAGRALRAADAAGALTTEVTMGTTATSTPALQEVRPHDGQQASARNVRRLTEGSEIVEAHRNCDRVQDAYSIRCLPQVHGAVRDALVHLRDAVEVELNSATDNPLVFDGDRVADRASGTETAAVLSGGNFHGEPLALRLDYLVTAVTELAAICERRVDRMVNPNVQEPHLPPFLVEGSGLQSGLMIPQYAAAALVNENRAIGRAAADNTPVSGNQEDHVSMSAQAAMDARRAVENLQTVVGIELLCAAQAAEFVDRAPEVEGEAAHGAGTAAVYEGVREVVPPLDADRPLYEDVDRAAALVAAGVIDDAVEGALGESLE